MKKPLLALASLLILGFANSRAAGLDWLATATGGFIAMPPASITDGAVNKVSWSPDGEYLMVVERPNNLTQEEALLTGAGEAPGPIHAMVWDHRFQRTRQVWSSEDLSQTIENIAWISGSSTAYLTLRWMAQDNANAPARPVYGVVWMDANSGKYLWVPGMERLVARPHVFASPTRPLVAIEFSDNPADDASENGPVNAFVTSDGSNGNTFSLTISIVADELHTNNSTLSAWFRPKPKVNNYWTLDSYGSVKDSIKLDHTLDLPLVWNQDGAAWYLKTQDESTKKIGLYRLTRQGKLEPTDEIEFTPTERKPSLETQSKPEASELGKSKINFESLWLKSTSTSDRNEVNLTPNGSSPELSPTDGAVFYIDGGVAKVRLLIPLSKSQLKAVRAAAKEHDTTPNQPGFTLTGPNQIKIYLNPTQGPAKAVP